MWYVGLDVHAKSSTYCVLDANGKKVKTRTVHGRWDRVVASLGGVKKPWAVCFEATTGYGFLCEQLGRVADRVVVAHPGKLRLIFGAKRKNDRIDAQKLAKLLYLDMVPRVWVPSAKTRSWRAMIEYRRRVVDERTRVKNALRALLRSHGLVGPKRLWTRAKLDWLKGQTFATEVDALRRDMMVERLERADEGIERVEKVLKEMSERHAGVGLLRTVPGIGPRTAEAVMAYIDEPARFDKLKAVGSYFGLVPCQDASGDRNRLGHITREGPATVRKLLVEAAWQGIRRSPEIRAFFERVQRRDPDRRKIAVVATAHYLLRAILAMLRTGEVCRFSAA